MKRLKSESGQTLILVAVSLSVLLGFAAFATDLGVVLHQKRLAQSAADSAAIAAALSVSQGGNAVSSGQADATANGFTNGAVDSYGNATTVHIYTTPIDGGFIGQVGYVEATISQQAPTFFMRVFGRSFMTVNARAVATYKGAATGCIYVLNPKNAPLAANPWGNSTISAPNCGFLVNGNIKLGASDTVTAGYVGASGTITGPEHINGSYSEGIAQFGDPLARLSGASNMPTVSGSSCTSPKNSDGSAGPACFLNVPLSGTLAPGVYMYTNPSSATYTGNVVGNGVTVILTNGSILSTTGGSGKGNATITLTAPQDNSIYNGIVLDAPTYSGELDLDFGSTVATLTGTVYAPNADLSLQDQGGSNKGGGAGLTINGNLILGTLDVYGKNKGNLTVNSWSSTTGSPIPRIALVE